MIDNDVARVVFFAFDARERLTEHTAAPPVVVQLVRGRLRFEVAGVAHELQSGDVVYLAPGRDSVADHGGTRSSSWEPPLELGRPAFGCAGRQTRVGVEREWGPTSEPRTEEC